MCIYTINMKIKETKKLYSFRIHLSLLEYLRQQSKKNYTNVTQYLIDLINEDMKCNKNE